VWSESRALLRPQFLKQRLSDLQIFENHVNDMISLLPSDGSTIDIMDWFYRFTLDAATHYLFGKSVDSIKNPKVQTRRKQADHRLLLQVHLPLSKKLRR
jgi:cytochrome P450